LNAHHIRKYSLLKQCLFSIIIVLVIATGCFYLVEFIDYRVVAMILLMTVSFIAMIYEMIPVLIAAVLSAVTWNFFFIPPVYTFHINNAGDVLMFIMYFIIALVNAVLTFKIRDRESKIRDREEKEKTIKLYNTLINSLSHELRTPIATIVGSVDALKENKGNLSASNQTELLSEIEKAGLRLNRQVENLLNMSRLESGNLKIKTDWCDINELIHSVLHKNFQEQTHSIKFSPNENLPLFKIDAGLMEQVLHNLIHNAVQYTPAGTEVLISVDYNENNCVIVVKDQGPGFHAEEISNAFNKFYRLPNTRAGGSGLGLSIVKGFVEAHNGSVTLRSTKNKGSEFIVSIPAETSFINNLKNE
jgi:two-component system, OmpR family, sensor histidine kinase KdpD